MTFELTADQVTQYLTATGGLNPDADMNALKTQLMQICIEAGLAESAQKPLWDLVPCEGTAEAVLERDQPFSVSFEVDIHPDIDWPDWSALEITRPLRTISEDMIEAELQEQCRGVGTTEPINGDFEGGDVIQVEASVEDVDTDAVLMAFTSDIRVPSVPGRLMLANFSFEGLYEGLKGRSVGDEIQLKTIVPPNFVDPTLAGRKIRATLAIKSGMRITPATVEQVLKHYGTPNEVVLREQIKLALEATAKRDQTEIVVQQVLGKVLDLVVDQIHLPDRVIKLFVSNTQQMMRQSLQSRGLSEAEAESECAKCQDAIMNRALMQIRQHALVSLLAQRLELRVSEQNIMRWAADFAARQGRRPEDVRKELNSPEQLQQVAIHILREKVGMRLLDGVTVTDVDADEWIRSQADG